MHDANVWDAVVTSIVAAGGAMVGAIGIVVRSAGRLARIEERQKAIEHGLGDVKRSLERLETRMDTRFDGRD